MGKTTMLEFLEEVSDKVEVCWEKDNNGFCLVESSSKHRKLYSGKIRELMDKAAFDDEMIEHTGKDIASYIDVSNSMFSRLIHGDRKIKLKYFEKALKPILRCLSTEGNLADDEMKKYVGELLFRIFRRKEVKGITEHFVISQEFDVDGIAQRRAGLYWHEMLVDEIFGNPEQTQDISYGDYFIDGEIGEEEMKYYIGGDILLSEYRIEDDSKRYVVIFDVKWMNREYLHQRIRCLQRKDNVFAVLMVGKGEHSADENFYRDEHSNIMMIEYEEVWEENSEDCSYNHLSGSCLSWYDERCKSFMTEGIDKIFASHK